MQGQRPCLGLRPISLEAALCPGQPAPATPAPRVPKALLAGPANPDGTRGSARTRQRAPCPEGTAGWTPAPSLSSHGVLFLPQCHRLLPAFLLRSVSSVAGCPQPGPLPRSRVRGGAQTPARPERPGPEDVRGGPPITGCHSAGGGTPGPRRRPAWTVRPASPWETWAAAQAALVPPSDGRREASWPTRPVINGVCPPRASAPVAPSHRRVTGNKRSQLLRRFSLGTSLAGRSSRSAAGPSPARGPGPQPGGSGKRRDGHRGAGLGVPAAPGTDRGLGTENQRGRGAAFPTAVGGRCSLFVDVGGRKGKWVFLFVCLV